MHWRTEDIIAAVIFLCFHIIFLMPVVIQFTRKMAIFKHFLNNVGSCNSAVWQRGFLLRWHRSFTWRPSRAGLSRCEFMAHSAV